MHAGLQLRTLIVAIAALLLPLQACDAISAQGGTGSARVVGNVAQGLSDADVARMTVTVTANDIDPIIQDLVRVDSQWQGTFGQIRTGDERTFVAEAFDSADRMIYRGQAAPVTILRGEAAQVFILLQQTDAAEPFSNQAPRIDAFFTSASEVAPGATLTFQVTAHDPNPGDTLSYGWEASDGSFADSTSFIAEWTAPQTEGMQTITIRVSDQEGQMAAMSMQVNVTNAAATGQASVVALVNTWPEISSVLSSQGRIDVGESTTLSVTANDNDGDTLSYAWSADCDGWFDDALALAPVFSLQTLPASGECTVSVMVSDGRGGINTGSIGIATGMQAGVHTSPAIDETFQSHTSAANDESVVLRVTAHDPDGTLLSFSWSSSAGTIGPALDTSSTSEVTWTAPSDLGASATVTVTISDEDGGVTTHVFTISGAVACINCSFEDGFAGWTYLDLDMPLTPINVSSPGTDGALSVHHGFDGSAGTIQLWQDMTILEDHLLFDFQGNASTSDIRTFDVVIEPAGGGTPLRTERILSAGGGGVMSFGPTVGTADMTGLVGDTVRIKFLWTIPNAFTGPGDFQLDNVRFAP